MSLKLQVSANIWSERLGEKVAPNDLRVLVPCATHHLPFARETTIDVTFVLEAVNAERDAKTLLGTIGGPKRVHCRI